MTMMANEPEKFKEAIQETLRRHATAVNKHSNKGTYFFDYGNAFLLEASRAGADIMWMMEKNSNTLLMYKTSWDLCVLIMDSVLSVGYVLAEKQKT